jgi:omega-6 fatty acid desaturase (delta-12 desaturase)
MLHHATAGNLDRRGYGDVDTWTVSEYLAKPRLGRLGYRLFRNPLVMMSLGPVLLFLVKHRLPLDMPLSWKKEWSSILWNNVALVAVLLVMSSTVGLLPFLAVQIPVFLISATAGIWLFYVQHQYERTYWKREERWDFVSACLQGSSYLDLKQPLRWFTGDIGVHHVHHLCSAIPNYRLKECMDRVKELPPPRRLTFWQALRCGRLSLWDEESERLIGFKDLRRLKFARVKAKAPEEELATVG